MMRAYIFFFSILIATSCQHKPTEKPPTNVTAYLVEPHTIPADFTFVSVARSSHPVEIRARVEGYLVSLDYEQGAMLEENTLMYQIDHAPFLASLEEAYGELARQQAVLWRAQQALQRITPLYHQNAASQRDYDDAYAGVLTAEASVITAQGNAIQAELNLSYTYITSPIKGLSGKTIYQVGTLITRSINGLLTYVSVVDPIWVYFSVSDDQLLRGRAEGGAHQLILPPQEDYSVTVKLADGTLFPYTGKVTFTAPILDPNTGTMLVRAVVPNPDAVILPGQFLTAIVSGAYRPNALFVPQESVFQGRAGKFVFVINQDKTVSMRQVTAGEWYENYWIIEEGLHPGETVVVDGINKIQQGSEVNILSTSTYKPK